MSPPLRVLLDATPLLGVRTGVGRYTGHLLAALAGLGGDGPPLTLSAAAWTWRGRTSLPAALPFGVAPVGRRVPARLLQSAWSRVEIPRASWLVGPSDVLHATNFVLPPPGRAAGVVTVHDLGYLRVPQTVSAASARYRELVPRSLRRAQLVLTPSRAVAAEVAAEYGLEPARVVATPLGVDPAWFAVGSGAVGCTAGQDATAASPLDEAARPRRRLPERYLLFVGTVEPRKDLPTLLRAYRMLLDDERNGPSVPPLILVGPSGWGPALDLSGIPAERVLSMGYLDESALRPVVAGATVLCFPSLYEGFGLPPLEALAAGTPVVAGDVPAVREVVGALDAPSGPVRLAAPGDAAAFAAALRDTLTAARPDPSAGRALAEDYTWAATAVRTAEAYAQAVELRG